MGQKGGGFRDKFFVSTTSSLSACALYQRQGFCPHSEVMVGTPLKSHAHFERLHRRLRWQLLAAYTIPLLLVSSYFYLQHRVTLRREVEAHLRSIAENRRNTVDLYLQERVVNVSTAFRPGAFEIPPSGSELRRVLEELQEENGAFTDVGLFDPEGTLVAYAGPHRSLLGRRYADEPWFRALHDGQADRVISDVFLGFRDRPHFVIAVKREIETRDGNLGSWTLRASVDPQRFGELVNSSHLIEEGRAYIVNRDGERQTLRSSTNDRTPLLELGPPTRETQVVETEQEGNDALVAISWLTEQDWAVIVRAPSPGVTAPLGWTTLLLAIGALMAVVITIVLSFRSTTRLVGRLEAANTAEAALRKQLLAAGKLASVGEMAAGVAHEINNPLAIIHEEAGILLDILDPELGQTLEEGELKERLCSITSAAMRGRDITSKLLAFSRHHDATVEPVDVNAMLDEVVGIKAMELRVANIEVEQDYAEPPPTVMVNYNEIEQVLLNLFNNARDAIDREGTITLKTRIEGDEVVIEVGDSGCGMTPEQTEQVFFPFYTTKEVGKGTGLGLSISHGIIEAHGGRIELESVLGQGTVFTITLPSALDASPTRTPRAQNHEGCSHV